MYSTDTNTRPAQSTKEKKISKQCDHHFHACHWVTMGFFYYRQMYHCWLILDNFTLLSLDKYIDPKDG